MAKRKSLNPKLSRHELSQQRQTNCGRFLLILNTPSPAPARLTLTPERNHAALSASRQPSRYNADPPPPPTPTWGEADWIHFLRFHGYSFSWPEQLNPLTHPSPCFDSVWCLNILTEVRTSVCLSVVFTCAFKTAFVYRCVCDACCLDNYRLGENLVFADGVLMGEDPEATPIPSVPYQLRNRRFWDVSGRS